jgi:ABC-type sugar transport system ATPase subunit
MDFDLEVEKGMVFGLLGPNGAGKTTLIRIVNQIIDRDSGEILINGEPLKMNHVRNIGYLPEERGLYKGMRVDDQLLYFAQIKGLKAAEQDYLFFCEHDVLYHPSHFDFVPPRDDIYYYDNNVVKYRISDRKVVSYDCSWLSMLCASRELLIKHYETRLDIIAKGKKAYGYERKKNVNVE